MFFLNDPMNNLRRNHKSSMLDRRAFLVGVAGACVTASTSLADAVRMPLPDTSALKQAGQKSGKLLGMFTVQYELLHDPTAAAIIAKTFGMIADGNNLKFSDELRPAPDVFNFSYGDLAIGWAEQHKLLFRGHCLVWWNALPKWFQSYVTPSNAKRVMVDHIDQVVKHYAGRVYSWDVVNECIYHDRPDGLRKKPWLDMIGPDYIDLAFHTAHDADPKARLVLNECYIEHATPAEQLRRSQLLNLALRLKKSGVPITHVGVQGHLRGATALDRPGMVDFCKRLRDAGLEIMITEFDVDDDKVPAASIEQVVASKYGEFIDIMGPYVKDITFEGLRNASAMPRRADGNPHLPNMLGDDYTPTQAFNAIVQALNQLRSKQ